MTRKSIQRNINALEGTLRANRSRLSTITKQIIRDVIELYQDRKIAQVSTASKMINELITATTKKEKEKAMTKYEKLMIKHTELKPLTERMEASKKEKKEKRKRTAIRTYSLEVMFFSYGKEKNKMKPSFRDNSGTPMYPFFTEPKTVNVKTTKDIEEDVRKKIIREDDRDKFNKIIDILSQDFEMKEVINRFIGYGLEAVKIYSATEVEGKGEDYDPKKRKLRNSDNIGIYHRFIETELDPEYETFAEAIRVKHYVKHECWINTLTDFYGSSLMSDKRKKQMTRENVLELLGTTEYEFKTVGASIKDMEKVFHEYRITARIYDYMENLIFTYDPPKRDHNYKAFYALVKNDHIYTINTDYKKLRALMAVEREHSINVKASSDYHINERDEPVECRMIDSINDLNKHTEKDEYTMIYSRNNLAELYYQSKQAGYEPYIKFTAGVVSELNFRFKVKVSKKESKTISYKVKTQNLIKSSMDGSITVETEQTYNNMSRAMYDFNQELFNPLHKSYYNETDMEVFRQCHTVAPTGKLHYNREYSIEIDRSKAYTWAYNQIVEVPVFNQFDVWKAYDYNKHDFNEFGDLTIYLVRAEGEALMFFNKPYLLIYGMFLKHLHGKCQILYYKRPSHIYKVNYKKITDKLWETGISNIPAEDTKIKKLVANVNIGLLEKGKNKAQKSLVFDTLSEALYHQTIHGGRINKISGWYAGDFVEVEAEVLERIVEQKPDEDCPNWVECIIKDETDETKTYEDGFILDNGKLCYGRWDEKETQTKYYTLTVSDTTELTNGFKYIKELLLQIHNFRMYEDYYKLADAGISVGYVKTDAFLINIEDLKKAKKLLNFSKQIGGWRAEKDKQFNTPSDNYEMKPNELVEIPTYETEKIQVEDEWDTDAICKQIVDQNPVIIKAKYAGSGKSYIGEYMKNLGYNVLFVCPTNQLLQNTQTDATTNNKFFAIPMEKGDKMEAFDHSSYNCIVFDEVGMGGMYVLNKIREFVKKHAKDKIIIATADGKQLPPIKDMTNTRDHETYLNECINQIFKHKIYLKISKRLKKRSDKRKLKNIYDDIWIRKLPIEQIVEKYFKTTGDLMASEHNIAYTNRRCLYISNTIRKNLGRKDKYEVGEYMICRKYKKEGGNTFNVNFKYQIMSIGADGVVLRNIKTNELYNTSISTLDEHFRYGYCATCHSSQGASVDKSITIHEWQKQHLITREWLWTSLTRATDINKVMFYKSEERDDELNEATLMRYLDNKVKRYKLQDIKAGRTIDDADYVDVKWLYDRMNSRCNKCGCSFEFDIKCGEVVSNLTAQRLDNNQSHSKDNCIIYCSYCNCSSK